MTQLTVPIMVGSLRQALRQAAVAAERGADLVEYRFDAFVDHPADAAAIVRRSPLPCIATTRPDWEGGQYEGDEPTRLAFIEAVATAQPAYLDVELAAFNRSAEWRRRILALVDHPDQTRPTPTGLILSSHDFQQRPADLLRKLQAMVHQPACRVVKLAWRARSLRDNLEAFEIIASGYKPSIALCMGEFGLLSRVLARKFGALLTFAGLDDQTLTAPGQVGVQTMKSLYRWDALGADTAVYGVIGWPVAHSMSPAIHNAAFDAVGHPGVYLPLPIPAEYEHFKATMTALLDDQSLDFRGASVTIPHKEHLLRLGKRRGARIEKLAERIGAANTLVVGRQGALDIFNTDYAAALDAVCHAMNLTRKQLKDRRVAVIGAGGAARAIVAGFAHHGATVVIHNRTAAKARALAREFDSRAAKVVAAPMANLCKSCCEIYVNCTPIGMHPDVDATPMPELPASMRGSVVFDTIYNPLRTRLLAEAKRAGATVVSGVEMFVRQAAGQFEAWTGRSAPLDLFRQVVTARLKT
jgi:3-dehydroquinate dehydratase/shikimate dehydrogenase